MRALQFEESVSVRGLSLESRSSCSVIQPANNRAHSATTPTSGPVRSGTSGAKEKIIGKMMHMAFTTLDDFHRRQLRPGEPLPLFFVHDLKTLLSRAMPDIDAIARSQLVLHQFLVGLPVKVSRQLRASGETNDLDKTIERARLLMAIDDQEQDDATAAGS